MSTTNSTYEDLQQSPLPLVIGVTGHRDLRQEDIPALEETARRVLDELRAERPRTPLIVLSALAEGADRLVARLALKQGASLIVPLPMHQAEYERDFKDPESVEEFRNLLRQAKRQFVVPGGAGAETPEGEARNRRYAQGGAFIARYCQILVALWDGESSQKEGGTSQVVRFVRRGVPRALVALLEGTAGGADVEEPMEAMEGRGVVYHILTPRQSNPTSTGREPGALARLYPESILEPAAVAARFERIFFHIDRFNRDHRRLRSQLETHAKDPRNRLLPVEQAEKLPAALSSIEHNYLMTDGLAIEFRGQTRFARIGLFALVFVAVLAFGLYAHVDELQTVWTMLLYLIALALAYVFWFSFAGPTENKKRAPLVERRFATGLRRLERGDIQGKHLDYRALAEGLRVQFYWRLAGLADHVEDRYLSEHRSELDWIRTAIRNWGLLRFEPSTNNPDTKQSGMGEAAALKTVCEHWVAGQRDFFLKVEERDEEKIVLGEHLNRAFLLLGIFLIIVSAFIGHRLEPWGHGLLLVAAALAPVTSALIHAYSEQQALPEQSKQYERMSVLFASAWKKIDESIMAGDFALARTQLRMLGKEALAENGDWVLLHRERPLDVPKPG
jgi:hypothetical protein